MQQNFLATAIRAARAAGQLLRENFQQPLRINELAAHDIKLEIDVRTQQLITESLLQDFPQHALYGEEGIVGDQTAEYQWIVDPLDGTVNYYYGIPHFCTSIALRRGEEIIVGVIYDPIREELWAGRSDEAPTLNGRAFRVSPRRKLAESILSVGLSKTDATVSDALPVLQQMVHRARKCRLLGSAALDMAYVACGRLDAFIEPGVSLWDIAAGKVLVEGAGGRVELRPRAEMKNKYGVIASNGLLDLSS